MNIKNIESVFPITEEQPLAQINCHHENLRTNVSWHETFFMDKDGKVIANFKNKKTFYVRQLTSKHNNLFVFAGFDNIYHIVLVYDDLTYTTLNSYEDIELGVEDGCFAVKQNGLWGFINEEAVEIIEPQYENYFAFSNGFAAVCKNGKWGFINKQNEIVIPFEYEIPEYSCFKGNYAPVCKNGKFGFIDTSNRTVIPFKYENALMRSKYGKLFPVKLNGKWGFIDYNKNTIIPFEFDDVECNTDGYSIYHVMKKASEKELYGLVDARCNKVIIPCEYLSLCPNRNSIQAQKQSRKYVLLNWDGEEISEEYEFIAEYCQDGLYKVGHNGKFGYVDEKGKCVIQLKYQKWSEDFYNNFAVVTNADYSKNVINKSGSIIFQIDKLHKVLNLGNGTFLLEDENYKNYNLIYVKNIQ